MNAVMVVLFALLTSGCAATLVAPQASQRFVAIYDQQYLFCRIQVIRDTRSTACFVAFQCERGTFDIVQVPPEVCVP